MNDFSAFEKLMADTLGLDVESLGRSSVSRAVTVQMAHNAINDPLQYLEILKNTPAMLEDLIDDVIVPETWFFRDREPFTFLRKYIQEEWRPDHQGETLKILSVPCSTGEEAYSIVMTLFDAGFTQETFVLDAVEISRKALAAAMRAVYGKGSFRDPENDFQRPYFSQTEEGYKLSDSVVRAVRFYQDNLVNSIFLADHTPYHVVFCRNLLIYLHAAARQSVLKLMGRLLKPNGILFCGHTEMPFWTQYQYSAVPHPRSFACRKPPAEKSPLPAGRTRKAPLPVLPSPPPPVVPTTPATKEFSGEMRAKAKGPDPKKKLLEEARRFANQGYLNEAYRLCGEYLQSGQPCADVYCLMGLISAATDRLNHAEGYFQKALYLDPCHYEALIHTSLLFQQKGDPVKAALFKDRAVRSERKSDGSKD